MRMQLRIYCRRMNLNVMFQKTWIPESDSATNWTLDPNICEPVSRGLTTFCAQFTVYTTVALNSLGNSFQLNKKNYKWFYYLFSAFTRDINIIDLKRGNVSWLFLCNILWNPSLKLLTLLFLTTLNYVIMIFTPC
jgi:hypothetical protein